MLKGTVLAEPSCSSNPPEHRIRGQYEFRGVVYGARFANVERLLEFDGYRPDDIILTSYPKSGTLVIKIKSVA